MDRGFEPSLLPPGSCWHFPDNRTLVIRSEAEMKSLLAGDTPARPTWVSGWERASSGDLALALNGPAVSRATLKDILRAGKMMEPLLGGLAPPRLTLMSFEIGKSSRNRFWIDFADERSATQNLAKYELLRGALTGLVKSATEENEAELPLMADITSMFGELCGFESSRDRATVKIESKTGQDIQRLFQSYVMILQ